MNNGNRGVGLEMRYEGATAEIAERITARQHLQIYFVLLNFGYLALKAPLEHAAGANAFWIPVSVSVIAIAFTCWIGHQDCLIGLLAAFCRAAAAQRRKPEDEGAPDWFSNTQDWFVQGVKYRMFSNVAYCFTMFAACFPSLIMLLNQCQQFWPVMFRLLGIIMIAAVSGFLLMLGMNEQKTVEQFLLWVKDEWRDRVVRLVQRLTFFILFGSICAALALGYLVVQFTSPADTKSVWAALLNTYLVSISIGLAFYFTRQRANIRWLTFQEGTLTYQRVTDNPERTRRLWRTDLAEFLLMTGALIGAFIIVSIFAYTERASLKSVVKPDPAVQAPK